MIDGIGQNRPKKLGITRFYFVQTLILPDFNLLIKLRQWNKQNGPEDLIKNMAAA